MELNESKIRQLVRRALAAREFAYAPYSHFRVGAAVLDEKGRVFTGCNVENASYGATVCAERNAVFAAVGAGARRLRALALVGGAEGPVTGLCAPCGVCRQVMREFAEPETFEVILAKDPATWRRCTLAELLPESFGPSDLKAGVSRGKGRRK